MHSTILRHMYLERELHERLFHSYEDDSVEERHAQLQSDLEQFVTARRLPPTYIRLLAPTSKGVWEIRSVQPNPGIRVFGLFIKKDSFLATHYEYRRELGGFNDRAWKLASRRSRGIWSKLFTTMYKPRLSDNIHELISGAMDEKYFK